MSRVIFATHGRHALVGDTVYTVFQGDSHIFPDVPEESALTLDKIWHLGWADNRVPFMLLVPLHRPFYGPLFSRLQYDSRTIPIKESPDGSWALDLAVIQEWDTLERNLRMLLATTMSLTTAPLPQYFRFWNYPMQHGYKLAYRTYRQARFIALRSRDAFVPLMAAVSFMLTLMDWQETISQDFNWRDKVLGQSGIHYQWLAELESSPVGDFDAPKVGGIINMLHCEFKSLLPLLCRAKNMPLYLHWGRITDRPLRLPSFLTDDMIPTHREINHLRSLAIQNAKTPSFQSGSVTFSPFHDHVAAVKAATAATNVDHVPPKKFPPVERYSGQGKDEDWQSFFVRRAKQDETKAQRESVKEKESRMQRIQNASKGSAPGRKGARVYVWEDVDGFLVRRAAGRSHYDDIWENFNSNQRRYDSFRDEWDLCEAFDPAGQPDDDSDDDGGDDPWFSDCPLLPDEDADLRLEGVYSSSADLERVHGVLQQQDDRPIHIHANEAPDDLAYYRFGFSGSMGSAPVPSKKPTWREVCNLLGNSLGAPWAEPSSSSKETLCMFFGCLTSATSPQDVPEDMCDLQNSDRMASGKVNVRCEMLSDQKCYIVTPKTEASSFELVLTSAASVMEIVRRGWGPDLQSVTRKLLDKGIAFNFCFRDAPRLRRPPQFVPAFGGLGYRPKNYKPDQFDYAAYESSRNRFLRSPRGRAAMLRGGIIARLASEVVSHDDVCRGPSDDVLEEGLCLWDGNHSSLAYWDDQLTSDEVDLICGVYRVDTGQSHPTRGRQTTDVSWWPKPTAWKNSGLNVGYWSSDCEMWFQKRLEAVQSGKADLKSPAQWKQGLRFVKSSLTASQTNEILAAQSLATA